LEGLTGGDVVMRRIIGREGRDIYTLSSLHIRAFADRRQKHPYSIVLSKSIHVKLREWKSAMRKWTLDFRFWEIDDGHEEVIRRREISF
jgi:hypothetical protein